ncbi:MAG TPA: hypothetical protein DE179_11225 [Oceanospirillaceae bacterium]|nr:hypothetical protein [Oceanospirillaceae bacterium]
MSDEQQSLSAVTQQQSDYLPTLLKNIPGMAYRCLNLAHWPMTFVSDGCFELCGYERWELEQQSVLWGDFTHYDDVDEVDRLVRSATDKHQAFEVEYRIVPQKGPHKWVWERGRVVGHLDDGTAILEGIIMDITSLHRAKRVIREQREVLAHVERLNTLGEMTAAIAHELNQPLTAIAMYSKSAKLLNDQAVPAYQLNEILDKLAHQSYRAGAVIERMQSMSFQTSQQQANVSVTDLLREITLLAETEAHVRDFEIELRLPKRLPTIRCDAIQIQQVILNLTRNGMESMQDNHCPTGSSIVLAAWQDAGQVWISVTDRGCGVKEVAGKSIFDSFTSTKDSGMGLGLAIGRAIVESHGGRLTYTNTPLQGACFKFNLALGGG